MCDFFCGFSSPEGSDNEDEEMVTDMVQLPRHVKYVSLSLFLSLSHTHTQSVHLISMQYCSLPIASIDSGFDDEATRLGFHSQDSQMDTFATTPTYSSKSLFDDHYLLLHVLVRYRSPK